MSLLSSASVWTNEEVVSKKRQSTMKRPLNTISLPNDNDKSRTENTERTLFQSTEPTPILLEKYSSLTDSYNTNSIEKSIYTQKDQSDNIHNLINKITAVNAENDGNQLADFNPISKPNITIKKPDQSSRITESELNSPENILKNSLRNNGNLNNNKKEAYSANNTSSTEYSNYNNVYNSSKLFSGQSNEKPYYSKMSDNSNDFGDNSKLLEKINYMIHLMEEQQNEKTANITEEFILYTFLGIFVIFIVDSFARSGKYVR